MFYRSFEFFLSENGGVLVPKNNYINLHWFIIEQQDNIINIKQGNEGGQSIISLEQILNLEVEIPVKENGEIDKDLQNEIYAEYKRLLDIKGKIQEILEKYSI